MGVTIELTDIGAGEDVGRLIARAAWSEIRGPAAVLLVLTRDFCGRFATNE